MRLRAADSTAICVTIILLCLVNSLYFVIEVAEVKFTGNPEFIRMLFSVNFMVISRIMGCIFVNITTLIISEKP